MIFEYVLAFSICSFVEKSCLDEKIYKTKFPTHKQCAIKGYEDSLNFIKNLETKFANDKKIYVTFTCIELEKPNA
jgi:hypothetical protein